MTSMLAVAAACATSEGEVTPTLPPEDGGSTTLGDSGVGVTDTGADRTIDSDDASTDADSAAGLLCSAAGWCATELPDPSLNVSDIWPFENNAFAYSYSLARGRKMLEWRADAAPGGAWTFIDDNSQQTISIGVGNMYAPNENEVYYVAYESAARPETGLFGGFLFHAKRPATPGTAWTWSRTRVDCATSGDAPTVWGIGNDVYMFSCKRIYRLTGDPDVGGIAADGSSDSWTLEYTDDEPGTLQFRGGAGTPEDIWFVAGRGSYCTTIVRKTADGFERIADGVVSGTNCTAKPGYLTIPRVTDFFSLRPGELVAIAPTQNSVVRIAADGRGSYTTRSSASPGTLTLGTAWSDSPDEVWLIYNFRSILHGTNLWSDGGSYQYSTIALNGSPNPNTLAKIRGTSKSNLWAVGLSSAFHKTTP